MPAGLGVVVGGCGRVRARLGIGGQVLICQTYRTGMSDISSGWVCVCVQVYGLVWVSFGRYGQWWSGLVRSD